MERASFYGWFAEKYQWPPSVVDAQPWWVIEQMPYIARAYAEVQEMQMERARAEAEREARR
ncbi:hypothetical protein [Streptomyces sp. NPDC006739]|uniref:hypothetical protein n=1 Tax=Streptomyces sp. NPDC006739 TaxID=3364763 RepID=UPI0036B43475